MIHRRNTRPAQVILRGEKRYQSITVLLPEDLAVRTRALAESCEVSPSEIVRDALELREKKNLHWPAFEESLKTLQSVLADVLSHLE